MNNAENTVCILVDNGSLRAEAALFTRQLAAGLASAAGLPVRAASVAHSDRIDVEETEQRAVPLLGPLLNELGRAAAIQRVFVLPFMLVTGGAMHLSVKSAVEAAAAAFPATDFLLGEGLLAAGKERSHGIVGLFAEGVRATLRTPSGPRPVVVVVDHGSPLPAGAEARNEVGRALAELLAGEVSGVVVASMERRAGAAYDFNEPLLRTALRELADAGRNDVILARLFLQPGRHSGVGGDIDRICDEALRDSPSLRITHLPRVWPTERLIALLLARLEALQREGKPRRAAPSGGTA